MKARALTASSLRLSRGKVWISACAVSDCVLFSGLRGELFSWEALGGCGLKVFQETAPKPYRAAPMHSRPIFGMRAVGSDHVWSSLKDSSHLL